ncbi:MAG TPA: DUF4905 domain-containing protein [Chryseosolibacter sp.]
MSTGSGRIEFDSSQTFSGVIWKTLVDDQSNVIYIESRDGEERKVTFAAWDIVHNEMLWSDVEFEEKWWISLGFVQDGILLLTHYTDTNNPDNKSVMAFDVQRKQMLWWKNNFVVAYVAAGRVVGHDIKFGSRQVTLDIISGNEVQNSPGEFHASQNLKVIQPLQYIQGTSHFDTVKAFIERKCAISPTHVVEYCEYSSMIIVSVYTGTTDLANYLMVFNSEGDIVLKEQLGENLKGIAYDTFFILAGFLIFVKNKRELISYRFV